MKKLMVVTPYFYPYVGGMEKHIYTLVKGLKKRYRWKIVVVTSNHESTGYKKEIIEGIKVYRLPKQFKISNTPISFKWKKKIKEIIKKEKPDVINGRGPVPFISDVAYSLAKSMNIPFILGWHFPSMKKGDILLDPIIFIYENLYLKKMLRGSQHVISSSDYIKDTLLKKYSYKTSVINQGLDKSFFRPFKKIRVDKDSILFVGNFSTKIKGLEDLFYAMRIIKKKYPQSRLNVVGIGDLNYYHKLLDKLNLGENIVFKGKLEGRKLVNEYQRNEIFILPSQIDNLPSVILEAIACKKPIIATKVGSIPYIIKNGKNGLLIPPKNSKALAEAIIKLLKNTKFAKKMGENGYKNIKKEFMWEKQIKKTKEIIELVINKK